MARSEDLEDSTATRLASGGLARGRVKPADGLWLQDSPTNRMVINGFYLLDELDLETIRGLFDQRVLGLDGGDRFPRFRWRVVWRGATPHWELDPHFNVSRHVVLAEGLENAGKERLQEYIGQLAAEELPTDRPPWQLRLVPKLADGGSALIFRLHHCLGDGVGLVPILFSMMDAPVESSPGDSGAGAGAGAGGAGAGTSRNAAADRHAATTTKNKKTGGLSVLLKTPLLGPFVVLGKMLQRRDRNTLHGTAMTGDKQVAWSTPIPLAGIKALKEAAGATVNDVLMTCVAGALRRLLEASGESPVGRVRATVPVDVRSPKRPLKMENRFASVLLELPCAIDDPHQRLAAVRQRMNALKRSVEPLAMFGAVRVLLTVLPQRTSRVLADFLANKTTCILTNVPGPQEPIFLAGRRIRDMVFWVPQRADIGIGVSIISFNGTVRVGVLSDQAVLADPNQLIDYFQIELAELQSAFAPTA